MAIPKNLNPFNPANDPEEWVDNLTGQLVKLADYVKSPSGDIVLFHAGTLETRQMPALDFFRSYTLRRSSVLDHVVLSSAPDRIEPASLVSLEDDHPWVDAEGVSVRVTKYFPSYESKKSLVCFMLDGNPNSQISSMDEDEFRQKFRPKIPDAFNPHGQVVAVDPAEYTARPTAEGMHISGLTEGTTVELTNGKIIDNSSHVVGSIISESAVAIQQDVPTEQTVAQVAAAFKKEIESTAARLREFTLVLGGEETQKALEAKYGIGVPAQPLVAEYHVTFGAPEQKAEGTHVGQETSSRGIIAGIVREHAAERPARTWIAERQKREGMRPESEQKGEGMPYRLSPQQVAAVEGMSLGGEAPQDPAREQPGPPVAPRPIHVIATAAFEQLNVIERAVRQATLDFKKSLLACTTYEQRAGIER